MKAYGLKEVKTTRGGYCLLLGDEAVVLPLETSGFQDPCLGGHRYKK